MPQPKRPPALDWRSYALALVVALAVEAQHFDGDVAVARLAGRLVGAFIMAAFFIILIRTFWRRKH